MTEAPTQPKSDPQPITLWLTDRTRIETGLGRCARKRYLSTAFGPTGYGITATSESLPLTTGIAVHDGVALIGQAIQTSGALPDVATMRAIVGEVQAAYLAKVEARGFLGMLQGPLTDETIAEQRVLISGLLWALRLKFFPWFHETYQILSIEEERLHVLTCTCGAGPLPGADHVARGCTGIALMLRRDLLARRRSGHTLAYFEFKTTGWESDAWAEQWETKPQLGLGALDTETQFGAEVGEIYVVGVNKGRRAKDRYEAEEASATGDAVRKKQQSPLCYGYRRPGNPPLLAEDWLPAYQWVTDAGETKKAPRAYKRAPVWDLIQSDYPAWRAYQQQDPEMSPEEFWVRMLPSSLLDKVVFVLGPMNRQDQQLASVLTSVRAEEERWQAILWELYEVQHGSAVSSGWASPEFQSLLDRLVPCAWTCRPYGKEHQCEFVGICHRHEGWQDPLATGRFKPRRPHHDPELQQAVSRGLITEQAEDEAIDEEHE